MPDETSPENESREGAEKYGFNEVYHFENKDQYDGQAEMVMLLWHDNQLLPAEQYRKAHYDGRTTDAAICEDPNIQKEQLGDKGIIYHFSGNQSSGGGGNR